MPGFTNLIKTLQSSRKPSALVWKLLLLSEYTNTLSPSNCLLDIYANAPRAVALPSLLGDVSRCNGQVPCSDSQLVKVLRRGDC